MSSGNISKYKFLTGKDVLPEKDLLEKAATMKRFEYSSYQTFSTIFNHDEKEEPVTIKKREPLKTDESRHNLIYDSKYSFSKYRNIGKY